MQTLREFLESLQMRGQYTVSKNEILKNLGISNNSANTILARHAKENLVRHLGTGLYLIIPVEYRSMGAPPPEWYIDNFMNSHNCNYYVGLLSAAAHYGATHQAVQVFQVVCNKIIRPLTIGRTKINFYYSKEINILPKKRVNTHTGYINVSTPEVTAFDLLKFIKQSGHINHVATTLTELAEKIHSNELATVAKHYPPVYSQRLGYILDFLGWEQKSKQLYKFIETLNVRYAPLRSDSPPVGSKNLKWYIIVNEELEPDI